MSPVRSSVHAQPKRAGAPPVRRLPRQRRARETRDAVLDAVSRVLARGGAGRLTTNRIAQAAGVSIGSLYQYFPDKQAVFLALRDRHVNDMARLVEDRLLALADAPLDALVQGLTEAIVEAHALDPTLYLFLLGHLPADAREESTWHQRLTASLRLALMAHARELDPSLEIASALFILPPMMESLAHAVALHRPAQISRAHATREAARAILAYLRGGSRLQASRRPSRGRAEKEGTAPRSRPRRPGRPTAR